MIPNHHMLGLFGLMLGGIGLVRKPTRTDGDRLRDIDAAEQAAIERAQNPRVIAAEAKRERKRLKRLVPANSLTNS